MKKDVVFFDTEVCLDDKRIHDIGAVRNGAVFHSSDLHGFCTFASGAEFVCGHNIVHHDLQYLKEAPIAAIKAIDRPNRSTPFIFHRFFSRAVLITDC